jgi:hypothetical protein
MQVAILIAGPVIVSLELTTFLLCGKHDYDANVLLPHDTPEVLFVSQHCQ